jgi:hypothetical protein
MPNNGQRLSNVYFESSVNTLGTILAEETQAWDTANANAEARVVRLEREAARLDNEIRLWGGVRDTQEQREIQNEMALIRLEMAQGEELSRSQDQTLEIVTNSIGSPRADARKAMAGEGGASAITADVLASSSGMNAGQMVDHFVSQINLDNTMGRFLAEYNIAGAGAGGEATGAQRLGAAVGIAETLRRVSGPSGSIPEDVIRAVSARVTGLGDPSLVTMDNYNNELARISVEALEATSGTSDPNARLLALQERAAGWGLTPEQITAGAELQGMQARRGEVQTELDAQTTAQAERNREEEIQAAFRARAGSIGSGADLGGGFIGMMRRKHRRRRNNRRREELENMSESERILMGSIGEAREMALSLGADASANASDADRGSWDTAQTMFQMAQENSIGDNDALVELAGQYSNGDHNVRNQILRNYIYLKDQHTGATNLRTPEEDERVLRSRAEGARRRVDTGMTGADVARGHEGVVGGFNPETGNIDYTSQLDGLGAAAPSPQSALDMLDDPTQFTETRFRNDVLADEQDARARQMENVRRIQNGLPPLEEPSTPTPATSTTTTAGAAGSTDALINQLNLLADEMGVPRPRVTSTGRTAEEQASAMYNNWQSHGGRNGGREYLVGLYANDAAAREVDRLFADSEPENAVTNASIYLAANPISDHQQGNAIDFGGTESRELLEEAQRRGIFTGQIMDEGDHLHIEYEAVSPTSEEPPTPVASQEQVNPSTEWNALSPEDKLSKQNRWNTVLSQAWGTPNQATIANDILGRMPPGSRLYYPQGGTVPVVISEYDLRVRGLPSGGVVIRDVGTSQNREQQELENRQQAGIRASQGTTPTSVYPSGVPRDLMQVSEEATRAGESIRTASAAAEIRRQEAERRRLQNLLNSNDSALTGRPPGVPFTSYQNIQMTPTTTYETIPLVPTNAHDAAVAEAEAERLMLERAGI